MTATLHDVYSVIHRRRDTRREFTGEIVSDDVLDRVLRAAHAAPSVGMSQPWDFVIVRSPKMIEAFREHVHSERDAFAERLSGERATTFARLKIEGIREAGLGIVVCYDAQRGGPVVLGRQTIDDAGLYSVICAIQNLWLAATAEGLGVGWVSFYREDFLKNLVGLPSHIRPVAWLCVGAVAQVPETPDLERHGWRSRSPIDSVIHHEQYGGR
jgi:5,6-dimethylbenzimidazole synthase